jgi:peptidoglycan/xylan/chitin deacetylase (PgdA/CDA1 family)
MERLRKVLSRVFASKLIVMRNERAIVSFTFDDVPRSAVTTGARILESYGACGTFYIAGSLCERELDGILYFRSDDLPDLVGAGHEIGCHTFNHIPVIALDKVTLERETGQNSDFVAETITNQMLCNFAYPLGEVGPRQKFLLQRRFASCRSTEPGINVRVADLGFLRAFHLCNQSLDQEAICGLIERAVRKNGWLIFYTHDVEEELTPHGCRPELFECAVREAIRHQADVLTIRNAIGSIAYGA